AQAAGSTTVAAYIQAAPKEARAKLREMRAAIRAAAPGAAESVKWGMPAYSGRRILVTFAAHASHIGFYPTPSAVSVFAPRLKRFKTAKGSIQFPLDQPLPLALIREITGFRVRESEGTDAKWRS
ncbi:MAG: iron chaperone, partial [Gemmatimonadales bacterium]